jgi:hypothetical protein
MAVSIEDAFAIYDLFGRYCYYVDHNFGEEWADLYTEDGVADGILPEVVAGREQLSRVAPDSFERFGGKVAHQLTNPMIDYGASTDEALVKASGLVTFWDNGGSLFCFAYYDMKLVRIDGQWKIKRNDVRLLT